jgi:hypothetical protein
MAPIIILEKLIRYLSRIFAPVSCLVVGDGNHTAISLYVVDHARPPICVP